MTSILFLVQFFVIATLSQLFSILMNYYTLAKKAKDAVLIFNWREYWHDERPKVGAIFCVIFICMILLPYAPPGWNKGVILIGGSLMGYAGTTVALQVWGVANDRLNKAIGAKALVADETNGTMGVRTPAAPVVKTK